MIKSGKERIDLYFRKAGNATESQTKKQEGLQLTSQESVLVLELGSEILKKFNKGGMIVYLLNKKNFNLLKSAHSFVFNLADLIYGFEFFQKLVDNRDPAFFEILEKVKKCIWGEGKFDVKPNIFEKIFLLNLVEKTKVTNYLDRN